MNVICKILKRPLINEDGIALIMSMLFVLLLSVLAIAVNKYSSADIKRTVVFQEGRDALFIADAGIENARFKLISTSIDTILGNAGVIDLDGAGGNTVNFNGGSYTVVVTDNDDGDSDTTDDSDNIAKLTSTGTTAQGTTKQIVALVRVSSSTYAGTGAIITDGDLKISGNPSVQGTLANVHTNSNFDLSGNPTINGDATATGTYDESGSPTITGTKGGGKAAQSIPAIVPSDFKQYADYVLKSDGRITDGDGNEIWGGGGGKWNGWDLNPGQGWTQGNNSAPDGMYYIEGDVKISGNPGTVANPWQVSLIATGDVEISGNPEYTNYMDTNDPVGVQNLFLVAGEDVKMSGNPTQTITGIIAAHEQVSISGDPSILGMIIAADDATDSGTVSGENTISGNPTITNNGTTITPFSTGDNTVSIITWNG